MANNDEKPKEKQDESKPSNDKPNTEIKPPSFGVSKHSFQGETINFIDKQNK